MFSDRDHHPEFDLHDGHEIPVVPDHQGPKLTQPKFEFKPMTQHKDKHHHKHHSDDHHHHSSDDHHHHHSSSDHENWISDYSDESDYDYDPYGLIDYSYDHIYHDYDFHIE